jgi:hypothetical protein
VRSRTTWFALGALAGVLTALLLVWLVPATKAVGSRTLVVGTGGAGAYSRIGDALQDARAGDTVRVEPGIYPERLEVPDGVHLLARVPSSVTLARTAGLAGEWVAIRAVGELGGSISGIRIESTTALPVDVGIQVGGSSHTIELVEMDGPMRAGIDLLPGAGLTLHGGYFAVQGSALTAGDRSQATVTRNVFLRTGRPTAVPVVLGTSAQTTLRGNLFAGYTGELVKGASAAERQQIAAANVIVTAEPSHAR